MAKLYRSISVALLLVNLGSGAVAAGASADKAGSVVRPSGEELLKACTGDSADFCLGFIAAAKAQSGDKYLARPCPPPIGNAGAEIEWISAYMGKHPEFRTQSAADVIFDATTEELSRKLGTDCSIH